jgi:pyruvate dehydrogenase E1 component
MAVIIHDGLRRMCEQEEDVFYYITAMNENYAHPALPEGAEEGILRGIYRVRKGQPGKMRVQLFGSGTILREVLKAAEMLEERFRIPADVWSVTSFNELRRDGIDTERWNMLHPGKKKRVPYITTQLEKTKGPIVAATDYMRSYADQVRNYIDRTYVVLGTDGYGRSDMRAALRRHFEVNRYYVVVAALTALAGDGVIEAKTVTRAIKQYGIDPEKPNPVTV